MTIHLSARKFNISVINTYAPMEDTQVNAKDEFYNNLSRCFHNLPRHDVKIIVGDLNAKIGKDETWRGTIGMHSLHNVSNDNGERLVYWAAAEDLVVTSTLFPNKDIHKMTWKSPDGRTLNHIDHVLATRRFRWSIKNTRSYRGADADTDHFLEPLT